MATYIVGDLHGCLSPLLSLLDEVNFDRSQDQLWLTGDLVARGPDSLELLRFIKALGKSAQTVLGNHDLHLIALATGTQQIKAKETVDAILHAPDRDELIEWLRQQPLLAEHPEHHFIVTHAGIPPQWDLKTAKREAKQVQEALSGKDYLKLIKAMYNDNLNRWKKNLNKREQQVYTINALTRMRFCDGKSGELNLKDKSEPIKRIQQNADGSREILWRHINDETLYPWFACPARKRLEQPLIFGHWASLMGYRTEDLFGLDTGYVWGNELTLLRWEDQRSFVRKAHP